MSGEEGTEQSLSKSEVVVVHPPNKTEFEKAVADISEEISKKQKLIEPSQSNTKNLSAQLQAVLQSGEQAEEERRNIGTEIKSIDENIRQLGSTFTKERDQSNRLVASLKYKSQELYDEQIKKLESQLQGGAHFSFNDRRKLQQTIENHKEAKIKLKDYLAMRETMDRCRTEQDELRKRKDTLHQRNKSCRERITSSKDEADKLRKEIDKRKIEQKEKKNEQEAITKELNQLYQKRKQLNDDFKQKQTDYINYRRLVTPIIKTTPTTSIGERPHKQISLSRSLEGTPRDSSIEEEKLICRTLINYLSRLSGGGNSPHISRPYTPSPSSHSPDSTPSIVPREISSGSQVANNVGTYHVIRKGEEEEWIPANQRDRRDRRRIKKERRKSFSGVKTHVKPLQHNATIFGQFNKLGLHPPISSLDIPLVMERLNTLLIRYDHTVAESEDSGIMSSTGISDIGTASGEVTPNSSQLPYNRSPSPLLLPPPPSCTDDDNVVNDACSNSGTDVVTTPILDATPTES